MFRSVRTVIRLLYHLLYNKSQSRSWWSRGLRLGSAAARPLRLWVRIPPGAWMSVCCECLCCESRGPCGTMVTPPEESYRLWCLVTCELETSRMRKPRTALDCNAKGKKSTSLTMNILFVVRSHMVEVFTLFYEFSLKNWWWSKETQYLDYLKRYSSP